MSADKMPPLSALDEAMITFGVACAYKGRDERIAAAEAVREAARAYAAEQTRELVEALEQVEAYLSPRVAHKPHGEGATMLPELRALIAKHKATGEQP